MDFEFVREETFKRLDNKRIEHTLGCESEAARLARRWKVNEDDARLAAILHDITKNLTRSEQFTLCEKYDIMLDNLEKAEVKLLHAKTGAFVARDIFNVSEDVFWAIYFHTTACENMSELEKIIYMADYIEPGRIFDGVSEMRKLAYEDLDAAMLLGLTTTMEEMLVKGRLLHTNTVKARNWLLFSKYEQYADLKIPKRLSIYKLTEN